MIVVCVFLSIPLCVGFLFSCFRPLVSLIRAFLSILNIVRVCVVCFSTSPIPSPSLCVVCVFPSRCVVWDVCFILLSWMRCVVSPNRPLLCAWRVFLPAQPSPCGVCFCPATPLPSPPLPSPVVCVFFPPTRTLWCVFSHHPHMPPVAYVFAHPPTLTLWLFFSSFFHTHLGCCFRTPTKTCGFCFCFPPTRTPCACVCSPTHTNTLVCVSDFSSRNA